MPNICIDGTITSCGGVTEKGDPSVTIGDTPVNLNDNKLSHGGSIQATQKTVTVKEIPISTEGDLVTPHTVSSDVHNTTIPDSGSGVSIS